MAIHPPVSTQRDHFIERFRHLGLRVTPQRLLILEALETSGGHMTADAILHWTAERYPAINLATIYRTLDLLTSVGLVTQTDLGGGASEFEIVGDTLHHHLVCEQCGSVTEVDDALLVPMRERLLRDYGFRASARHIGLFGVCKACLSASRARSMSQNEQPHTGAAPDATATPPADA
ncbi:MAG: Fur family transcriptional regulator [Ktedonobacterales bacterium]